MHAALGLHPSWDGGRQLVPGLSGTLARGASLGNGGAVGKPGESGGPFPRAGSSGIIWGAVAKKKEKGWGKTLLGVPRRRGGARRLGVRCRSFSVQSVSFPVRFVSNKRRLTAPFGSP